PNQLNLLRRLEASITKMPGSLAQRLSILGRSNANRQKPAVQIMTLHASKGLEFDNVWIMGCEAGICRIPTRPRKTSGVCYTSA
ncbi:3'-5' exonuclease, partial [Escherichia coli]|uniref:3'-5' exonuclease n=1 Tax=Escherichia coli TaxID=562 RepID=UPI002026F495